MKSICVYCGSSLGKSEIYLSAAKSLANELVSRNIALVYGGASVGIMGQLADTVLAQGGEVIGVIPRSLFDKEIAHSGLTELQVVDSMHERKAMMEQLSDGFIALPGGMGTLEELFEILTWAQLGFHTKPCGVLNVAGYYDGLLQFLDHTVDQAYVRPAHRELLLTEHDPASLLSKFDQYQAPSVTKWIDRV